jgi:hypothetical protein
MASPFWKYPGVKTGRLQPAQATAQEGSYVFCIGEDEAEPQDYRIRVGEEFALEQKIDAYHSELITFAWKLKNPSDMPAPRTLLSSEPCEFKTGGLLVTNPSDDGLSGVELPESPTGLFLRADSERLAEISGTSNNNGTFRISSVPWNQGKAAAAPNQNQVINGRIAIIENDSLANESPASATIKVLGLRWVARAYIGSFLRCEMEGTPKNNYQRNTMTVYVGKYVEYGALRFELKLEAYS